MAFFVQYNESGLITSTVMTETAPEHPRQLEFAEWTDTTGKMVEDGQLVDAPIVEVKE